MLLLISFSIHAKQTVVSRGNLLILPLHAHGTSPTCKVKPLRATPSACSVLLHPFLRSWIHQTCISSVFYLKHIHSINTIVQCFSLFFEGAQWQEAQNNKMRLFLFSHDSKKIHIIDRIQHVLYNDVESEFVSNIYVVGFLQHLEAMPSRRSQKAPKPYGTKMAQMGKSVRPKCFLSNWKYIYSSCFLIVSLFYNQLGNLI